MIICGTGHRPDKCGGYDDATFDRLVTLAYDWLLDAQPDIVISGMALGWDQALAAAAIEHGIPVHAYFPFMGQANTWPKRAVERYVRLSEQCAVKRLVSPGDYSPEKMQIRNKAMVDDCHKVLALWNGSDGGTANCLKYARKAGKPVVNLWDTWNS